MSIHVSKPPVGAILCMLSRRFLLRVVWTLLLLMALPATVTGGAPKENLDPSSLAVRFADVIFMRPVMAAFVMPGTVTLPSPHFRLEQFLCKQTDDMPQFALVRTRLLQALEHILAAINDRGHLVHVDLRGYRAQW